MYQITTVSTPASIIIDDAPTTAFPVGSTAFWKDIDTGLWHTVEVANCNPRGFGFACIKWQEFGTGTHVASVPFAALRDLDGYLAEDDDYGTFEAADTDDFDYPDDDTAYDSFKDDMAERRALHALGNGA